MATPVPRSPDSPTPPPPTDGRGRRARGVPVALPALALLLALLLAALNVVLGPLNLDEGWYLYAAKSFAAGARPYRDFFFTQAPLLPAVYGALAWAWSGLGVLGGRLLTALFGLAASALAARLVASAAPPPRRAAAALTAFLLLGCNVYHSYFTAIPKTYSLAALCLTAGMAMAFGEGGSGRSRVDYALAALGGFLLAAAAAARLSLGAALPVAGLWLLAAHRRRGLAWLFFGMGGLAGLGLLLAPFAAQDFGAFAFANLFHGQRSGGGLALAAGSVSRLARNYLPIALLAIAATAVAWRTGWAGFRRGLAAVAPWLAVFAAVFAVHVLSPFPYDDYQVPVMPLLACAGASVFWNALPGADAAAEARTAPVVLSSLLAVSALCAFTSPLNESWVMVRKDRFWVEMKKEPDLLKLRRVGRALRGETAGGELLTTDTYLAVEARATVPPGLEMGAFGYFPNLPDDDARRFHVLNRNLLAEVAETTTARRAAFSGYAFAMAAPEMGKIPENERGELVGIATSRFEPSDTVPDFGQEHTELLLFRRRQ